MSTPPEPDPAAPRGRWQFTLRRLFVGVFVVALLAGAARWVYVRTIVQRETVLALRDLGAYPQYAWLWESTESGRLYAYFGDNPPVGRIVTGVSLPIPLSNLDEARRVNRLLRTLPHLIDVEVRAGGSSKQLYRGPARQWQPQDDHHFLVAVSGLRLRGVVVRQRIGEESLSWICQSSSITAVTFNYPPPPADFQKICEARHITHLAIDSNRITSQHLQLLENGRHLRHLRLSWHTLDPSIGPADLAALGELTDCDLQLLARNLSDSHIRDGIARLPNLTRLSLPFEAPADDAVAALAAAPRLKILSLQDATVSDEAIIALAKSRSLEELNVAGTDVSEEALLALREVPTLRLLTVSKSLDLDRLEAGLPNVEIAWGYVPPPTHTQYRAERKASADAARAPQ